MTTHVLLDIEALGKSPGSAIIELAAVAFCPETGKIGQAFEAMIEPQAPFTADLETLEWHRQQGTWPRPFAEGAHSIGSALVEFGSFAAGLGDVEAFWAWGATYDFPLLTAAYDFAGIAAPWDRQYWKQQCARTVWRSAFGDRKHGKRPHVAIEDCRAAVRDLMEAMNALLESVDKARLDWLESNPLKAEIIGGADDGHVGKAWAVSSATLTLRESLDVLMAGKEGA